MYKNLDFDPDRAFAPIAPLAYSPMIIVGSPNLPVKEPERADRYAKANRGPLNAGTVGVGSQAHISIQLLNKLAGISIGHVPYRITSQSLPDLVSGDLQLSVQYVPTFVPQVQSGMLEGLAITSRERLPEMPDVPTVDESGFRALRRTAGRPCSRRPVRRATSSTGSMQRVNEFLRRRCGRETARQYLDDPDGRHAGAACRLH